MRVVTCDFCKAAISTEASPQYQFTPSAGFNDPVSLNLMRPPQYDACRPCLSRIYDLFCYLPLGLSAFEALGKTD